MAEILTQANLTFMLKGAGYSLLLALGGVFFGAIMGVLNAAMKLSHSKILHIISSIYVEIFRGTPMLLQVLFFYLGVPVLYQRIFGTRMNVNPYMVGLIALSLNSGAYQTELFRSGIQGVDKGQWEACETLGVSYHTMMKEIILPQAFKRIIPPFVSEFITLIKDSSLISNIGALELLYSAQLLGAQYFDYLDPLIIAGVMYLIMTVFVSWLSRIAERRLSVSD
ncbi:MAG: amino acid ABC transporter permease [Erysipelotrichaceae bacterium]|nr:amino acid ABC transporter permease [Erysipelotrichaceae bacterium]